MAHRTLRRRASATAGVALLLATAACSAVGDRAGDDATDACTAPGVTPDSVKVGLIFPDTGPLASIFTPVRGAAESRIALQNEQGGVGGRTIDLEWRDDAASPSDSLQAAQDLVETENVFGIIQTTIAANGSAQYLDDAGVPVTGVGVDATWTKHHNMFTHSYSYGAGNSVTTFGTYVAQAGGTKAFLIDEGSATGIYGQMLAVSLESQGIPVVDSAPFSPASDSAERMAARIAASGADVLLGGLGGPSFAPVVQAVHDAGTPMKAILGLSGYDSGLLRQYGPGLAGLSVYIPYTPFESGSPAIQEYRAALRQYAPQLPDPDREAAIQTYIATDLFIRGLEAAGTCPTRASYMAGLRAVKDYDADGLLPAPIDMEASFGILSPCYSFVKVNPAGDGFTPQRMAGASSDTWCGNRI